LAWEEFRGKCKKKFKMKKVFLDRFQKRLFLASGQSKLSRLSLLKRKDLRQSMPIFTLLAKN